MLMGQWETTRSVLAAQPVGGPETASSADRPWGWRGESGATVVEYALMLVFVAAGLIVVTTFLGAMTRGSIEQVSVAFGKSAATDEPSVSGKAPADRAAAPRARMWNGVLQNWRMAGVLFSLMLNFVLWYLLYRRQRQQAEASPSTSRAAEENMLSQETIFALRQQLLKILASHMDELLTGQLRVRHVMMTNPCLVQPKDALDHVARRMNDQGLRYALVCDQNRQLLGLISRTDLISAQGNRAEDVMTAMPCTVHADEPVNATVTHMLTRGFSCLPVVDTTGRARGILALSDLALTLQCVLMTLQTMAARQQVTPHPQRCTRISDIVNRQQSEPAQDSDEHPTQPTNAGSPA